MQEYAKYILLDGFYKHIALFKEYLPEKTSAYILKKGPKNRSKARKSTRR